MIPSLTDPAEDLLDTVEVILRRGLPQYGITSPDWAEGDPCPADHWFLPEGTQFYRYDVPDMADPGPKVIMGLADKTQRRYPHDARYWDVPFVVEIMWPEDLPAGVWRTLKRRLEALFSNGIRDENGDTVSSLTILSLGGINALHIKDVECDKLVITESRPSLILRASVFCSGRRVFTTPAGLPLAGPSGFTLTF